MPEFWLDADTFIESNKGPYAFEIAPSFWTFLHERATEGIIASSTMVCDEIVTGNDDIASWARERRNIGLFVEPDEPVQATLREIADFVQNNYRRVHADKFLGGADPWLIAHAKTYGGRIVTYEREVPSNSQKVKIPNICNEFDIQSLNLYAMLRALRFSFS